MLFEQSDSDPTSPIKPSSPDLENSRKNHQGETRPVPLPRRRSIRKSSNSNSSSSPIKSPGLYLDSRGAVCFTCTLMTSIQIICFIILVLCLCYSLVSISFCKFVIFKILEYLLIVSSVTRSSNFLKYKFSYPALFALSNVYLVCFSLLIWTSRTKQAGKGDMIQIF